MAQFDTTEDANHAFYRAFEKKNIDAMALVWSHGIDITCVHPGRSALKGWDEIRSSWQQIFKHTQYLEIDWAVTTTETHGAIAYVVGIETVMQVAGRRTLEARSVATNIFEKMGDRWYLIHHHGSPMVS